MAPSWLTKMVPDSRICGLVVFTRLPDVPWVWKAARARLAAKPLNAMKPIRMSARFMSVRREVFGDLGPDQRPVRAERVLRVDGLGARVRRQQDDLRDGCERHRAGDR